jgi:hypothetical protein
MGIPGDDGQTGPTGPTGPQAIPSAYTGALEGATGSIIIDTTSTTLATTSITTSTSGYIWALATFSVDLSANQAQILTVSITIGPQTSTPISNTIQNNGGTYYNISHQFRTTSLSAGTYTITVQGLGDTVGFTCHSIQVFSMSNLA